MEEIEIEHMPTDKIPKDMKYIIKCKCGNITAACDERIPHPIRLLIQNTPCSKCVKPEEFIKRFK